MIINGFDSGSIKTAASSNWVTLYSKNITIGGNQVNEYSSDDDYFLLEPSTEGFVVPDLSCYRFIRVACDNLSITVGNIPIRFTGTTSEYTSPRFCCGFTNINSFSAFSHRYTSSSGYFWYVNCTLPSNTEIPVGTNLMSPDYNPTVRYNDLGGTYNRSNLGDTIHLQLVPSSEFPDYSEPYYFWSSNDTGNGGCFIAFSYGYGPSHFIYAGDTIYLCGAIYDYRGIYSHSGTTVYNRASITYSGTFRIEALPY